VKSTPKGKAYEDKKAVLQVEMEGLHNEVVILKASVKG